MVLVIGVESCNELDRAQKVLNGAQLLLALFLEIIVRTVLVGHALCSSTMFFLKDIKESIQCAAIEGHDNGVTQ